MLDKEGLFIAREGNHLLTNSNGLPKNTAGFRRKTPWAK